MPMVVLHSNLFTSHYTLGIYMLALHEFQSITIQLSFLHVTYYVGVALELL